MKSVIRCILGVGLMLFGIVGFMRGSLIMAALFLAAGILLILSGHKHHGKALGNGGKQMAREKCRLKVGKDAKIRGS